MFCSKCGTNLKSNDSFCGNCGTKIEQRSDTVDIMKNKTPAIKEENSSARQTRILFIIVLVVVLLLQSKSIFDTLSEYNGIFGAIGQVIGGTILAIIITVILNKFVVSGKVKK